MWLAMPLEGSSAEQHGRSERIVGRSRRAFQTEPWGGETSGPSSLRGGWPRGGRCGDLEVDDGLLAGADVERLPDRLGHAFEVERGLVGAGLDRAVLLDVERVEVR